MIIKYKRSEIRFYWYFGLFSKTILKVMNFRSFVNIFHSKCCFLLYSLPLTIFLFAFLFWFCKSMNLNTYAYTLWQIRPRLVCTIRLYEKITLLFQDTDRWRAISLKKKILPGIDRIILTYNIKTDLIRKHLK